MAKKINDSVSVLFKATRKFYRLQQTEFATILGVTQGTISKVESALMSPDLHLWFNYLKAFSIKDPYCFTYTALELSDEAFKNLKTEGSALAPAIRFDKGVYLFEIREIRPLFDFLNTNHRMAFDNFLKDNKISKSIFYILNHPLNTEFIDKFFSFLTSIKINEKPVLHLNLNFENSLGIGQHNVNTDTSAIEYLSLLSHSSGKNALYEFKGTEGEYFINISEKSFEAMKHLEHLDLIMKYTFLYPYLLLKSNKKVDVSIPQIQEIKKNKWKVTYASK